MSSSTRTHYWSVRCPDTGSTIESVVLANVLGERRRLGLSTAVRRVDVRELSKQALRGLGDASAVVLMPWAQFDDHSPDTVAWIEAGGEALGLHLLATCWCAAHLSDGDLPEPVARLYLARFSSPDEMVRRLEAAGLWERTEAGWQLPGFLEDNRSREAVEADRRRRQESGRRGGQTKAARDRAQRSRDE